MDYSNVILKIKPSIALILTLGTDDTGNQISGKGSGFVFAKKGLLVTCNHVVSAIFNVIKIKFPDAVEYIDAEVVLRDEEHDLALLKFSDDTREPLKKCDTEVTEGMPVIFSGYPLGLSDLTTHQGILSAIIKDAAEVETYVIDGSVNRGNSGCPLMTEDGEVMGVVNATRRERTELLRKVEEMQTGAVSLYGTDLIEIYQALIKNLQLGIGYSVPAFYIPEHRGFEKPPEVSTPKATKPKTKKQSKQK